MGGEKRTLSFGITGEFITQIAREWFYSGEKSIEKIMEILMDSMTGTDTPKAQIRRYAEDILMGRAALKGNTADGTYHLETYEPGEEEELPSGMNVWKIPQSKKVLKSDLDRMTERFNVAMEHLSEGEQRAVRKELGEETNEDREQARLDSFITRMMDEKEHTTGDFGWLEPNELSMKLSGESTKTGRINTWKRITRIRAKIYLTLEAGLQIGAGYCFTIHRRGSHLRPEAWLEI